VLRQVHGRRVLRVGAPGERDGEAADGAVASGRDIRLAVLTADCAPVALASPEGCFAVAHAGWRGLVAGVLEAAIEAMRAEGAGQIEAVLGPCIHAECYEFGPSDLDAVVAGVGSAVRARDRHGRPALDLVAGVHAVLERAGVDVVGESDECTACSGHFWSWRARRDTARQAMVAWRP